MDSAYDIYIRICFGDIIVMTHEEKSLRIKSMWLLITVIVQKKNQEYSINWSRIILIHGFHLQNYCLLTMMSPKQGLM